jgi:replicative DNA helicase
MSGAGAHPHPSTPKTALDTAARAAPHGLDAEMALLGAILFDNEVFNRITPRLEPKHFYDPVHGRIFQACADTISSGGLADGVTMRDRFARDGALKDIGGAAYLLTLLEHAAKLSVHAQEYAELIYDFALRRELIRVGGEITTLAEDPPEDADAEDIIEEAEKALFSLAEGGTANRGFQSFSTALTASMEVAAAAKNRGGDVSGISSGFHDLDHKLGGLHASDLLILAGRPSMGKTALALNIALHVARAKQKAAEANEEHHSGGVVGFFSLEMSAEQLATRLLSDFAEIESHRIRQGKIEKLEYERLKDAAAMLQTLPLNVDETGGISIAQLHNRARRLKRTSGLDMVVVDYLQLVTTAGRKSDGRVQEVSEITQGLKALAKDLNVPVLALSQLSRQVESREDKRPQLSDLRESGSIEQDADIVMFVYREEYYLSRTEPAEKNSDAHFTWNASMERARNKAELIIGKNRHGPIDTVHLQFEGKFTRFSSLSSASTY